MWIIVVHAVPVATAIELIKLIVVDIVPIKLIRLIVVEIVLVGILKLNWLN